MMFQTIAGRLGLTAGDRAASMLPVVETETMDASGDEAGVAGFEAFGRAGLDIGGLHRDQQWVGAWGGRC